MIKARHSTNRFQPAEIPDSPGLVVKGPLIDGFGIENFQQLSPRTLLQIRTTYGELARSLPKDGAAPKYLSVIDALLASHAARAKAARQQVPQVAD